MAETSWPSPAHNSRSVTDGEYEQLVAWMGDGIDGDPTQAAVVSAAAGLQVRIRPGAGAVVRGQRWESGADATLLPIAPNGSGQPRSDRVVLRLDRADWTVRAAVRQGTPGGGPPALVQDLGAAGAWEVLLAGVTVPAGATSVSVIRAEQYLGARVRTATHSQRPLSPERGAVIFETTTNRWMGWDGTAWVRLYDYSGVVVGHRTVSGWSNAVETTFERSGNVVTMRMGTVHRTGNGFASSTNGRLPILVPPDMRHPTRAQYSPVWLTGNRIGRIHIYAANTSTPGHVELTNHPGMSQGQNVIGVTVTWVVPG